MYVGVGRGQNWRAWLSLAKMGHSLWEGSPRMKLKRLVMSLTNPRLPSASLRPALELIPTLTNRLAAEKFHKKGFIAKLQERCFMTEDMECHPPQGGRQGSPCIFPNLLPFPLKLAFPLGPRPPWHGDSIGTNGIRSLRWPQSYLLNLVTYQRRKLRL